MRILLAPAKKMRVDTDTLAPLGLPDFLDRTERLLAVLRSRTPDELRALWKCNEAIAAQNVERLAHTDLRRGLTPAVLSYEGIAYRYLAPGVLEDAELDYLQEHLRILSGFYGMVRPFDGVTPYRLEMQALLSVDGAKDLYGFWGDTLARTVAGETDTVVDLASKEYSRAVTPHLPKEVTVHRCTFAVLKNGKAVEQGTLCKMARGEMVRWMAQNRVTAVEQLRRFDGLGFVYDPDRSTPNNDVFLQGGT